MIERADKRKQVVCGFHTTPICQLYREEIALHSGKVNEKKWRWDIDVTPPLFEIKRNGGSMKLPPLSTLSDMLKMEWWVGIPLLHYRCCGRKIPPKWWERIIKQSSVKTICCLVGLWNKKKGRRRHA
jgi:hypothetical protein